jgi:PAS domain S-box-containing protein
MPRIKNSGPPSQTGSTQKLNMVIMSAVSFIALVTIIAWIALGMVQKKMQQDTGDALQTVLQTTQESLGFWAENKKFHLSQLAADKRLVFLVENLLQSPRAKDALLKNQRLIELRKFFQSYKDRFGKAGFFIIAPDFINIASMRDNNIGAKNLIANQALDLLNKAFRGETVMVPPIWSDVILDASANQEKRVPPTMFFAAPVKDYNGQIIAVLTNRVNPANDFTRIIQLGRIGNSGETYAFGKYGKLLSESRFDDDLRKIGLIKTGQKAILSITIRDPGGNMVKGFTPAVPRYQQPLTLMAQQATQGESGVNVAGYRDYRGVPVYGAWLWDANLDIGLTTEIDVADALSSYYTARNVIIAVLAITVLLALASLIFAVFIDERANRALRRSHEELEHRVQARTAELVESEERFSLAVRGSGAAIWDIDLKTDKGWSSERLKRFLGYHGDEIEDLFVNWTSFIHPDDREAMLAAFQNHLDNDVPFNEQYRLRCKSGEIRWFRISGQALWDDSGQPYRMAGSVIDITAGKFAQDQLRKLSRATENSPASVVITDRDGAIEYVNETFCDITGYSAKEAIGQNPRILKTGDLPQSYYKELWRTILAGNTWRGDFINKKKSGEEFWESASISPIQNDEGEITHFVAVKQDITTRKQMENELIQAKQTADDANKAKGNFLANMSHEIRTPMNAVIGMSHLALKTELTTKQRDYLKKIQSSANSLLGIINDILDFSKIEAGKLDIEALDFNLDDVLENLANLVTVKAREKKDLEVLFAADQDVPRHLVGDPLRLGQVLINLANNAVKFTESGEIVVSIEKLERKKEQVKLKFAVRDTGIGLTKEQMSRLFQSFSQADTSTTRKYGGTGLGLAISKKLVNMMDGEIWVESEYGQGTAFIFTANFGLGKEKTKKRFAVSKNLRNMKTLVVDDNVTSREILKDILESFSFEVTPAASGEEGITEIENAAGEKPFELVIMDWKMPGMDGIEAGARIKHHPALGKIPAIILVTAYGREEIMQKSENSGLDGFLIKPVNASTLFDAIMQSFGEEIPETSRIAKLQKEADTLQVIRGARILLVEDNEINQQVAQEILEGAGLVVTIANDGREAVELVQSSAFDAVLMDIQMPVMDGYTATRKIREGEKKLRAQCSKLNADGRGQQSKVIVHGVKKRENRAEHHHQTLSPEPCAFRLPIIAMTAHAMAGDEEKSLEAGMNGHVAKPIDPDQLFATLLRWIKPGERRPVAQQPDDKPDHSVTQPARTVEEELPNSLPGFDLERGLTRMMGNKRLYRKVLIDFGSQYTEVAAEIRQALSANDYKQAHNLVHNLKGLAGNLEAKSLQTAAVEMEKLVKERTSETTSDAELNRKFAELENALGQALEAAQTLGRAAIKKTIIGAENVVASVSHELIREATESIKAAVEMGDVMSIKLIAEKLSSESDAMESFCNELIQLAENFNFDGIQKHLLTLGLVDKQKNSQF